MYMGRGGVAGPSGLPRDSDDSEYDHYSSFGTPDTSAAPSMRRTSASNAPSSYHGNAMAELPHYPGVPIESGMGAAEFVVATGASRRRVTAPPCAVSGAFDERPSTGVSAWRPVFSWREGLQPTEGARKGFAAIITAVETLTLCLAIAALGLDAWLAPTITSDRTIAGTKWAITHTRRAGLWTVCFDEGTSLLARDNPFYATAPSCSSAVSTFYKTQIYGADLWLLVVSGQAAAVFFVGVTAIKLFTGIALFLADMQQGPFGLQVLRRELNIAYAVGKVAQPVLGYALLGVLITVLKQTEDYEYATTHLVHNYAGQSFWIWLIATISVALGVFISSILPPSLPDETTLTPIHSPQKQLTEQ